MLAANAHLAPGYATGLAGIARSMPTSAAADRVAEKLGVGCYETPTGWKFFGNLLDAGHGDDLRRGERRHRLRPRAREGRAVGGAAVAQHPGRRREQRRRHRARALADYGRNYYSRHDYEEVDADAANGLMGRCASSCRRSAGHEPRRLDRRAAPTTSPITIRSTARRQRAARASASCSTTARASSTACPAPARPARRCASISSATSPIRPVTASRRRRRCADLIAWPTRSPKSRAHGARRADGHT